MTTTNIITDPASIAAFNRGPISSTFTAPASCLSTLSSVDGGVMYFGHLQSDYLDTACYPAETNTAINIENDIAWNLYYYSPAVACPSGWFTASAFTSTFGYNTFMLNVGSDTTAALCCPSGYTASGFDHQCASTVPLGVTSTFTYVNPSQVGDSWTFSGVSEVTHTVLTAGDWIVSGDGIPIWYQSSDQVAFSAGGTTTTSTGATGTGNIGGAASGPGPTTTGTGTETNAGSKAEGGLSTGAKAGIAIAAVILGITAIVFGIWFWLHVRKKRRALYAHGMQNEIQETNEYPRAELQEYYPRSELQGTETPNASKETPFLGVKTDRDVVSELYEDRGEGFDGGRVELESGDVRSGNLSPTHGR